MACHRRGSSSRVVVAVVARQVAAAATQAATVARRPEAVAKQAAVEATDRRWHPSLARSQRAARADATAPSKRETPVVAAL